MIDEDVLFPQQVRACTEHFLGYGNPNSSVWFIGTEEGGAEFDQHQALTFQDSISIRSKFALAEDFQDVWHKYFKYNFNKHRGGSVWNFIAHFLIEHSSFSGSSKNLRFQYIVHQLGRKTGDHFLAELFPLPKKNKNKIEPYDKIWPTLSDYIQDIKQKRIELLKSEFEKSTALKLIVAFESKIIEYLQSASNTDIRFVNQIPVISGRTFSLYKIRLNLKAVHLLVTPFFGYGRCSYQDLSEVVVWLRDKGALLQKD